MSDAAPRISVVIPAYNLADYLGAAIESVLEQTLDPELIDICVVDDGSTDDTRAVVARYGRRVRYVHQENRGLPATRNAGVRATTAPLLAFLDADDRFRPEKFARELAILEEDSTAGIVYSGWQYIDAGGQTLPQRGWSREEGDVLPRLLLGNLIHPHAAIVRRELVEGVGGFDESLTSVEDWDLWLRISIAGGRWRAVDAPLLEYRVRDDGMHADAARMLRNRIRVLEKTFAALARRPDLLALRSRAFQQAYLEAACDHYRAGETERGAGAMREAVRHRPDLLTEPRALRQLCRLLLPLGWRNEQQVVSSWPTLGPIFHRMMAEAAGTDDPHVVTAALRRLNRWRVAGRYRRKYLTLGQNASTSTPLPA